MENLMSRYRNTKVIPYPLDLTKGLILIQCSPSIPVEGSVFWYPLFSYNKLNADTLISRLWMANLASLPNRFYFGYLGYLWYSKIKRCFSYELGKWRHERNGS